MESVNIEFKIFDESKEPYNVGDLLNMPYFFANWNNTPHMSNSMYNIFKKTAIQYKDNILGIYNNYRIDENEPFPNVEKIKLSVDTYIENNKANNILNNLILSCNDDNTLVVHLRSGDQGIVEDYYIDTIVNLSVKYEKIILLCGISQNGYNSINFPSLTESINNMKISLHKLYLKNPNIIIDLNEPDIHLSVMRTCKNLLLHKGGYSLLGGLLFNGNNLFITKIFNPIQANNKEYFTYVKNYTII
jgi:hypothetical protein